MSCRNVIVRNDVAAHEWWVWGVCGLLGMTNHPSDCPFAAGARVPCLALFGSKKKNEISSVGRCVGQRVRLGRYREGERENRNNSQERV